MLSSSTASVRRTSVANTNIAENAIAHQTRARPARIIGAGLLLAFAVGIVHAQLPSPGLTIYKCESNGKVAYTDQPCLGAKRLDVVPNRGVDRLSGARRIGADVAREEHREQIARALRPLTGMNEQQFATETRRYQLGTNAQRECRSLESAILDNERMEQRAAGRGVMESLQRDTLSLRQRYHELRC